MEIILSKQCESLTGTIGRAFGYHIQKRKNGFFGKRNTKGNVPPDGHWRFILCCANLAQTRLYLTDIRVPGWEIYQALEEAGFDPDSFTGLISTLYNAREVLAFGNQFKLNRL